MTNVCTDNRDNSIRDVMNIFNAMKIGEATAWALTIAARYTSNIYLFMYFLKIAYLLFVSLHFQMFKVIQFSS